MIFASIAIADADSGTKHVELVLEDWKQTNIGQWIVDHCANLSYSITTDHQFWGYNLVVFGNLSPEDETYYTLKFK